MFCSFFDASFRGGRNVLANPPKLPARGLLDIAADGWNKKNPLLRQATRGFDVEPSRKRIAPHDGFGGPQEGTVLSRTSAVPIRQDAAPRPQLRYEDSRMYAEFKINISENKENLGPCKVARRLKPPRRGFEGEQHHHNVLIYLDLHVSPPIRPTGFLQHAPVS